MPDLLIELFSEEIPARMQKASAEHLQKAVVGALKDAGLEIGDAGNYYTPRRLALVVRDVPASTPDVSEERRGPRPFQSQSSGQRRQAIPCPLPASFCSH